MNRQKLSIYLATFLLLAINAYSLPSISNVTILPENPNAGQDLLCNYNYTNPQNYTEQNSSFNWYKNGIGQNINHNLLYSSNLSAGDNWSCEVTGYDGDNFSATINSLNKTISSTVRNVLMFANSSNLTIQNSYFGTEKEILGFNGQLHSALESCIPDSEGYCNITLSFSSDAVGIINLSNLNIYYSAKIVSLAIENLSAIYNNGTLKIFEFTILNDGDSTVTDIQWQFDTGDGMVINSSQNISSLNSGEKAFVYVQYNYSTAGSFDIKANATGISLSKNVSASLSSTTGEIQIANFSLLNNDFNNVIFEVKTKNILTETLSNINWTISDGNGQLIASNLNSTLQQNELIFIYIQHSYANRGVYNTQAVAQNSQYSNTRSLLLDLRSLQTENLTVMNENLTKRIFEFVIKNYHNINITNISWTFDTKNSNVINSTPITILQSNENIFVYIDHNFTSSGAFNVNATARNGTLSDSINLTIIV